MLSRIARSSTSASRSLCTSSRRSMPVYVAILPDYINNEETRHANRQAALKDLARGHAMGNILERPYLSDKYATQKLGQLNPNQQHGIEGSIIILDAPDINAAWDQVKSHAFWTKVWDEEKAVIKELKSLPVEHIGGGAL